uniref:Uncharacterized protein n=1 Tax=Amphimedon queenslandica TaxID=400682 RepID=A0A1X7TKV5_AMPQE
MPYECLILYEMAKKSRLRRIHYIMLCLTVDFLISPL